MATAMSRDGSKSSLSRPSRNTPSRKAHITSGDSKHSHDFSGSTSDQVSVSSSSWDYFSMPMSSKSSQNKAVSTPQEVMLSKRTKPQDMLDLVRQSINSKSKTGYAKEAQRKSQAAIDQVRQSVDLQRTRTPRAETRRRAGPTSDTPRSSSSAALHSSRVSTDSSRYAHLVTRSLSSDGSSIPDTNNPSNVLLAEAQTAAVPAPELHVTKCASPPAVESRKSSRDLTSPIPIPPSSNTVARELALTSESMASLALVPDRKPSPEVAPEELVAKPGRKPPPKSPGHSYRSSGEMDHSLLLSETEEPGEREFPIFPGIAKKSRRGFFSRKKKPTIELPPEPEPEEFEPERRSSSVHTPAPSTPAVQPVKFKTTMRKTHRKSKVFNEDQPWKNHDDLHYISETQRKRYEGLWVSNKGLYMDRNVRSLVGVDKDPAPGGLQAKAPHELSEKDISEVAAKLSSEKVLRESAIGTDALHDLDQAKPLELIHGAVVKRIWSRSKLSSETLAAVWDLVDWRKDGTLSKSEFIVGMWLVDQCLYGRKLPKVLNKSIWDSLGGASINMSSRKKRR